MRTHQRLLFSMFWAATLVSSIVCLQAPHLFAQTISITTPSPLPDGVVAKPYSQTLVATGGTTGVRNWTVVSGALPASLTLSTAGAITGTPTTAGTSNFRVRVTSNTQMDEKNYTLTISTLLVISTTSPLPPGTQGTAYSQNFAATGGITPYTWSAAPGTLPAGLSLTNGGRLSGTPTASGTFNFSVSVADD